MSAPAVAIVDRAAVDGYARAMVDRTEEILLARAREGDEASFAQLVERHSERLLQLGWRLTGSRDLAEDLVQEAFLRLHRTLKSFRGDCSLATWLYRTLSRLAIDHLRREKLRRKIFFFRSDDEQDDPVELAADSGPLPDQQLIERERLRRVRRAMRKLSPQQRAVFTLRHDQNLPLKEIAVILELSEGTVKTHLHRAVQVLRAGLGDMAESEES